MTIINKIANIPNLKFETLLFSREAPVRSHLKNVYACLTMSVLSAAAGAYVHLFTDLLRGGGLIMGLVSFGLAIGLHMTPDNGKNRGQRLAMLLGKLRQMLN